MASELFNKVEEIVTRQENGNAGNPYSMLMIEWMRLMEAKADGMHSMMVSQHQVIKSLLDQVEVLFSIVERVPEAKTLLFEIGRQMHERRFKDEGNG